MLKHLWTSIKMLLILTMLTGVVYPLTVTAIAQLFFANKANGSLIISNGKLIGSELIGQQFDDPKYFWGRPSATSPTYNASASSGSNLGPTNKALIEAIKSRVATLQAADPDQHSPVPAELVTASASGLDPHISPEAAKYQIPRVARLRGISEAKLAELVDRSAEGRLLGIWGQPRVNVLKLNLALDELLPSS